MFRKGFVPPTRPGWPPFTEIWKMSLTERLALPEAPLEKSLPRWVLDPVFRAESDERLAQLIEEREGPEAAERCRQGQIEAGVEADHQWEEYLAGRLLL